MFSLQNPACSNLALTPDSLAESALALILPPPEGTSLPPLARVGGLLTPSTAMGQVLVRRLEKYGRMEVDCEILEGAKKGK
jgi:short subunit dehydrogenase-like uncharacterized protein